MFFSMQHIRRYLTSVCPVTGDINFGQWAEVILARLLHCKVTIFLFVMKEFHVGELL